MKKNQGQLISVVIPVYNNPEEAIRAVNSCLNQTYNHYEIIIVDDCSNVDMTILKDFIKNKENIYYYRNKVNGGPSKSRNFAFSKCNGEYIALLDSDDEFLPNKLEFQLNYMLKNDSKFSYTNYYECVKGKNKHHNTYTEIEERNELIYECKLATPTIMFEKKCLTDNSIKYDENVRVCEDAIFYLEFNKYCKLHHINKALTRVNVDEDTCKINEQKIIQGLKSVLRYVLNTEEYFNSNMEIQKLFSIINYYLCQDKDYKPVKVSLIRKIWSKLPPRFRGIIKKVLRRSN